jgi:hypothetical protein
MEKRRRERRKYERYDMETRVHFFVNYDLKTKVEFQVVNGRKVKLVPHKYTGFTRNISAEGMRFSSDVKLKKGERLFLKVYLPGARRSIPMTGEVHWSRLLDPRPKGKYVFDTGVKILTVRKKRVAPTIHFEEHKQVHWSIVPESVFGGFRKFVHKKNILH